MSNEYDDPQSPAGPAPWTAPPYQGGWVPPSTALAEAAHWPPPPRTSPARHALYLGLTIVLIAAGALAGAGIGHSVWPAPVASSAPHSSTIPGLAGPGGTTFGQPPQGNSGVTPTAAPSPPQGIVATVDPALVDINSTFGYANAGGEGTGIVLTSTGEVLTNNHVINGETTISITDVGNGKTYSATVVGYDDTQDIAVLQLSGASGLTTASIGNSSKLSVGESVVAIGNAGGTGGTPTSAAGSITALNQSITASDALNGGSENLTGLIQVNANVQSGDSGGSLVDSSGQVIGIDTAASDSQGNPSFGYSGQGSSSAPQGFAIPINQALSIAKTIESGRGTSVIHVGPTAFLGIGVSSQNSSNGDGGLSTPTGSGVTVGGVIDGEPAAAAGLVQGDVITTVNGTTMTTPNSLTTLISSLRPGDSVTVDWTDTSGQSQSATIVLASGPPQ